MPEQSNADEPASSPLRGRRILLTRPRQRAEPLRRLLEQAGARVLALPLIELALPADTGPLDSALRHLGDFAWAVFASPSAVDCCWQRLRELGLGADAWRGLQVAALGPATAAQLVARGVTPALVPARATQADLQAALLEQPLAGRRVLIPGSQLSRTAMDAALAARGAAVVRVVAYTNRLPAGAAAALAALETGAKVDAVIFASPSAVANLAACAGPERARRWLSEAAVCCIGPVTAAAVIAQGGEVAVQGESGDIEALVAALGRHFARGAAPPAPAEAPGP